MADWETLVHKAIAAFYHEIPAASKSSVSLQGSLLEIKVQDWQNLKKKTELESPLEICHRISEGATQASKGTSETPLGACKRSINSNEARGNIESVGYISSTAKDIPPPPPTPPDVTLESTYKSGEGDTGWINIENRENEEILEDTEEIPEDT